MARRGRGRTLVTGILVASAVVVRFCHVLTTGQALLVVIVTDVLGWALALIGVRAGVAEYRRVRQRGRDRLDALQAGLARQFHPRFAAFLVAHLRHGLMLGRWFGRRDRALPGRRTYRYDGDVRWPVGVLLTVLVIDGAIMDTILFVRTSGEVPWDGLGVLIYVVFWLLASLATGAVRPHILTDEELVLQQGALLQATVKVHDIRRVEVSQRTAAHACGWRTFDVDALELPSSKVINSTLYLRPGAVVEVSGRSVPAQLIHFYADQPRAIAAELTAIIQQRATLALA